MRIFVHCALGLWVAIVPASVFAEDQVAADAAARPRPALEAVPQSELERVSTALAESDDPAFEQFVSEDNLLAAFHWSDASQLADCALQLAHGERILLRPHRSGITPKLAMEYAGKSANGAGDLEALERLASVAKSLEMPELATQFATAAKTAAPSRGVVRRATRVRSAVVKPPVLKSLRGDKQFQAILTFGDGGRVFPRKGVVMYYLASADATLVFSTDSSNPPQYVTLKESTPIYFFADGGYQHAWCSCGGEYVAPGVAYDPTVANPSGNHCHFITENQQLKCTGFCSGQCKAVMRTTGPNGVTTQNYF